MSGATPSTAAVRTLPPPVRRCEQGCGRTAAFRQRRCCVHCPEGHTRTCRERARGPRERGTLPATAVGTASTTRAEAQPSTAAPALSRSEACSRPTCRGWRLEIEALRAEVADLRTQVHARDRLIETLLTETEAPPQITPSAPPLEATWIVTDGGLTEPAEEPG